jgi:hypothetical protein
MIFERADQRLSAEDSDEQVGGIQHERENRQTGQGFSHGAVDRFTEPSR